jgi:MtN3 and saliva related transmembrane protein
MISLLGLAGLICIVAAFIPETVQTIKEGRVKIPYPFLTLYLIGTLLLTYYASTRNDVIFMTLNGLLVLESTINLYYKIWPRHR